MKIRVSDGKKLLVMSRSEWEKIGSSTKWLKTAEIKQLERYYIEITDFGFNFWKQEGIKFFCIGIFMDNEWSTAKNDGKNFYIEYNQEEIQDELESPLKEVSFEFAQKILNSTTEDARKILDII
jgi:hypothetical protein